MQEVDLNAENQASDIDQQVREAVEAKKRLQAYLKQLASSMAGNKVRRNAPCPCGSGNKFKKCHLLQHKTELRNYISNVRNPNNASANDEGSGKLEDPN